MMLNTMEEISVFFKNVEDIRFVVDQMNALDVWGGDDDTTRVKKGKVCEWLRDCRGWHKAVLSTSANYRAYLQQSKKSTNEDTMHVYGGLTAVSLSGNG